MLCYTWLSCIKCVKMYVILFWIWIFKESKTAKSDDLGQQRDYYFEIWFNQTKKEPNHAWFSGIFVDQFKKNQLTSRSASNNTLLGSSSNRSNNQNTNTNFYERIKKWNNVAIFQFLSQLSKRRTSHKTSLKLPKARYYLFLV